MSATGLEVLDKSIQTTNIWLNALMAELGPDRQVAWKVLSTVLHKLRDRLPLSLAAHLGAQLPLVVRGVYYDQFEPAKLPVDCKLEAFIEEIAEWLSDARPIDPRLATQAVFALLSHRVERGQIEKIKDALPQDLRAFWNSAEASRADAEREAAE